MRTLMWCACAWLALAPAAEAECWMKPAYDDRGTFSYWKVFTDHGDYIVGPDVSGPDGQDGMTIVKLNEVNAATAGFHFFPGLPFQTPACKRLPE